MEDKFDGNIRIALDPEDDINYVQNYIESLPLEARGFAFKYLKKSFSRDLESLINIIEKCGRSILFANGIDTSLEHGFNALFRNKKNSGHYSYPSEGRRAIADKFFADWNAGTINSREAWASMEGISARTLKSYLEEFPEM